MASYQFMFEEFVQQNIFNLTQQSSSLRAVHVA